MKTIDWVNTPGGYYAIAYWISCCMFILNSPKKLNTKQRRMSLTIFGVILFAVMTLTHGTARWLFVPFMMLYVSMIFVVVYFNCKYDWKTAIYYTARIFIVGEFIASFEWDVYYGVVMYTKIPVNIFTNLLCLFLVDGLLILFLYHLERKNKEVGESLIINSRELFSAGAITLAIFSVSNLSYVLQDITWNRSFVQELFIIRTLVDLGGVAILYAYHVQMGELSMRFEVEKLQDMLNMQYHNYEMLEQSVTAVNHKYHDLKYQITLLKQETNEKESLKYLNQMEQDIKAYEAQNKTGNKVLDIILTGKALHCQNNWIELTSVADGSLLNQMDPMDISTLFGNMLDNAIESVSKIEHKERRLIHLNVTKQKNFLLIRVENCYDEKPNFEQGIPATTKKDKQLHGYGLKSIQSTVKKYKGSVTFQAEKGWFEVRILIPM